MTLMAAKISFMDTMWSNTAILEELGQRLQRERLNRNMTQQEVAEASGLSPATIKKMEAGSNFSMETLMQILRSLNLLDRLDALLPEPALSPIQLAKLRGKERERASGQRARKREEQRR